MRPEDSDLAHRLQRMVARLTRELRWESAEIGLSIGDATTLFDLRRHPGAGVTELASMANVSRSVASERLKRLEVDGLAVREAPDEADRRRIGFVITDGGDAVLRHLSRMRRNHMAARLATLSPAERLSIEHAIDALERLPHWRGPRELAAEVQRKAEESWGRDNHERRRVPQT